jgi:hypothetical protein
MTLMLHSDPWMGCKQKSCHHDLNKNSSHLQKQIEKYSNLAVIYEKLSLLIK